MSGVHTAMTNTRDTPVEALERALPLRVRRYGAAAGERRRRARTAGGDGIERELEVLDAGDGVARHRAADDTRRGVSPAVRRARRARTGCSPAATRPRARRLPDKCTVHARARRRAARPHPGWWGLGTARLTSSSTAGAAVAIAGANLSSTSATESTSDARTSIRRRPAVMRCSRSATNRASA